MSATTPQMDSATPAGERVAPPFVHPMALCESVTVGHGTKIWPFAQVMNGAVIGVHCQIGGHAFIEGGARLGDRVTVKNGALVWDGVTIGDEVFIGPGVMFTNDLYPRSARGPTRDRAAGDKSWLVRTTVDRGASIGAGAIIIGGVTIGSYALVAAGAVVTRDVPPHGLVVGRPAQPAGWVCVCGHKLDAGFRCVRCGKGWTPPQADTRRRVPTAS